MNYCKEKVLQTEIPGNSLHGNKGMVLQKDFYRGILFSVLKRKSFCSVLHSTLIHLPPPLRFHCVGERDRTQDNCDFSICCLAVRPSNHSSRSHRVVEIDIALQTGILQYGFTRSKPLFKMWPNLIGF
jgi:hypothetical protein